MTDRSEQYRYMAGTQERRKQQLKNYCLVHNDQKLPWEKKRQLEQFLIDDDNKFIYCAVPKVGSTPMRMTMLRLRNDSNLKLTESSVHSPKFWKRLSDDEFNTRELSKRLSTHFKFLLVRDPFHRLLSGYKDKFFGKNRRYSNRFRQMIVKALRPQDEEKVATETNNVTFTEFLTYLLSDGNPMIRDGHWKQVENLCFPCAFDFDFIGHFETLQEDADYLLSKAGFNDRVKFPVVRTSQVSRDFLMYYSEVPPEIILKLGEAFRSDFEMFGYAFPGPLKSIIKDYLSDRAGDRVN